EAGRARQPRPNCRALDGARGRNRGRRVCLHVILRGENCAQHRCAKKCPPKRAKLLKVPPERPTSTPVHPRSPKKRTAGRNLRNPPAVRKRTPKRPLPTI